MLNWSFEFHICIPSLEWEDTKAASGGLGIYYVGILLELSLMLGTGLILNLTEYATVLIMQYLCVLMDMVVMYFIAIAWDMGI